MWLVSYRHYYTDQGIIDDTVSCAGFDMQGNLWIGNDVCINLRPQTMVFKRIGGMQGLPYSNITLVVGDPKDGVWIGTKGGLVRYRSSNVAPDQWKLMRGDRWIHGDGTQIESPIQYITIY
jgi:ligand-binding sensor domain-containing protein